MNNSNYFSSASTLSGQVSERDLADFKKKVEGAEQRKIRLGVELAECRAIIRRKYLDELDDKGNIIGAKELSTYEVERYRYKRLKIETALSKAKTECKRAKRLYDKALTTNIQNGRELLKIAKEEEKIIRAGDGLLKKVLTILKEHGQNGGKVQVEHLKSIALSGDQARFTSEFESCLHNFDTKQYEEFSKLRRVQPEVMESIMEELGSKARSEHLSAIERDKLDASSIQPTDELK